MITVEPRWSRAVVAVCIPSLFASGIAMGDRKHPARGSPSSIRGEARVTDTPVDLDAQDEARKVAEAYLNAIAGKGDDAARDSLLGGATMTARIFTLANWKFVAREPHRSESGELSDVAANIEAIDRAGRTALAMLMGGGPAGNGKGDGLTTRELSADDAAKLLGPTKALASDFLKKFPVFAYVARVDRAVYWHPKNPIRKIIADAGSRGKYALDLNLFRVQTEEGLGTPTPRVWPLRVLRLKTGSFDTGWKILPASDWNGE